MRSIKLLYDGDKLEELKFTDPILFAKLQQAAKQQLTHIKKQEEIVKISGIGSGSFKILSIGI